MGKRLDSGIPSGCFNASRIDCLSRFSLSDAAIANVHRVEWISLWETRISGLGYERDVAVWLDAGKGGTTRTSDYEFASLRPITTD